MSFDYNIATKILLVVLAVVVLVAIILQFRRKTAKHSNSKRVKEDFTHPKKEQSKNKKKVEDTSTDMESMNYEYDDDLPQISQPYKGESDKKEQSSSYDVKPIENVDNDDYKAIDFDTSNKLPSDCYPRDRLTTDDLLPKDAANSVWAQVNPAGQGDVKDQNFMQAGALHGIDTVGQSLRNPNLQLRSDPPIPKIEGLSPWNNSTIEYDNNRRFFEIGST